MGMIRGGGRKRRTDSQTEGSGKVSQHSRGEEFEDDRALSEPRLLQAS